MLKTSGSLAVSVMFLINTLFSQELPDQSVMKAHAPATFQAVFSTTQGDFTLEVVRNWSPAGADRLYQLLMTGYFNQNSLFRVQKSYVVQFGISDFADVNYFWDRKPIPDEPVRMSNKKGYVSFARDGMSSRTTQLFINMKDNPKLDTVDYNGLKGFPPVGMITKGFEVVERLYGEYGFEPARHQDSIMAKGNGFLHRKFPKLDYIREAYILSDK